MEFKSTNKTIADCAEMKDSTRNYLGYGYYLLIDDKYRKIFNVRPTADTMQYKVLYLTNPIDLESRKEIVVLKTTSVYLPKALGKN